MGKYEPLSAFLKRQGKPEIHMTFQDIERLIGSTLPASATEHRAWWSNNPSNSVITKAWLDAGYRTEEVDMAARKLVFRKAGATPSNRKQAEVERRAAVSPRHARYGCMKGLVTIAPGVDLTEPADPDWAKVYE